MSTLERVLGGSLIGTLLKLLFLSLLVGAILAGLGLSPMALLEQAIYAFEAVFGYGFDAVRNVGRYVVTGAMIVIPIWILARVMAARR
jgi:hypothetical protein